MKEEILALADERLQGLFRQADSEDLVGYLLVDLSIDRWTQGSILPIHRRGASRSLFQGKPEEGFSAIAPHLMALDMLTDEEWQKIMTQDIELAAFSWLWIDETARDDLFSHLQKQLDMRLSDGGVALLRYYDPRVFTKLMRLLDEGQRQTLFGPIRYWSVCIMNERQVFQPTDAMQEAI
ncbi:DUF4123 domain-containing protein [Kushneria phyllosphaerae]|uniref:DUF4123 domain-containing protein n=1 Tax=Kushneria phyllosphaerae TaxID=2100822 RepID=A0A2R8CKX3_9GAMM|nr:DUF4123 domain-containing protein [Kushneria phyllosphaerae]SPJ33567.1 hypothetical protein KSP9073_01576 [Kushneria phyllosphaerae]